LKPVILGISGPVLLAQEREMLRQHAPRGVILFGRNIQTAVQLSELVGELRKTLPEGAVLMVDQEGGRVARLRPPEFLPLGPAGALTTAAEAYAHGLALGAMVQAAGFDVAAAPVLDLRFPGASDVVGDRAISGDAQTVALLGGRIADGILAAQVIPVMKHVPGHGRALVDSHLALPRVTAPNLADDFLPFQRLAKKIPWAMTAHIVYEALDPQFPATLSKIVIERVIRGVIGFAGVLVSDDLAMQALSGTPTERAVAALAAGCDIALYCAGDAAGNLAILEAVGHAG
jgi:beta-N-acetylhexosaminidase